MKKKKHIDYFDIEPTAKNTVGVWLFQLFLEGGFILLLYLLYKLFN